MTKHLSRREFLKQVGLATGSSLLLVGCGGAQQSQSSAQEEAAQQPEMQGIEIEVPFRWSPEETAIAQEVFQEETEISASFESILQDFDERIDTRLAAGQPFDLMPLSAEAAIRYVNRDVLQPLDSLMFRDDYDVYNFIPYALAQWVHNANIYGLPTELHCIHSYFNYDLFDQAGVTPPQPTEDWTWDQLVEFGHLLTLMEDGEIVQYGIAATNVHWLWELWPNLNGTPVFDEELTRVLLDDPSVIEAFDFYQNLMYEEGVALWPHDISQATANQIFQSGQLAILIDGTWKVKWLHRISDEIEFHWDIGLPPHNPNIDEYFVPTLTSGWVIPKNAQAIDVSWETLEFFASDTFAEEVLSVTRSALPTTWSALEGVWSKQWTDTPPDGLTPEFSEVLLDIGRERGQVRLDLSSVDPFIQQELDLIYLNEIEPTDLLGQLEEEVNGQIEEISAPVVDISFNQSCRAMSDNIRMDSDARQMFISDPAGFLSQYGMSVAPEQIPSEDQLRAILTNGLERVDPGSVAIAI